jgi:hypothetical protein
LTRSAAFEKANCYLFTDFSLRGVYSFCQEIHQLEESWRLSSEQSVGNEAVDSARGV